MPHSPVPLPLCLQAAAASPPGRSAAPASRSRSNSKRRDGQPSRCANCSCEATCLWRRDKLEPNRILCNACGIYKATNGIDRPLTGRFLARRNGKTLTVQRTVGATRTVHAGPDGAVAAASAESCRCGPLLHW